MSPRQVTRELTENVRVSAPLVRWVALMVAVAVLAWRVSEWKAANDALLGELVRGMRDHAGLIADLGDDQAAQAAETARLGRIELARATQAWDLPHQRVFCARLARQDAPVECPDLDSIADTLRRR